MPLSKVPPFLRSPPFCGSCNPLFRLCRVPVDIDIQIGCMSEYPLKFSLSYRKAISNNTYTSTEFLPNNRTHLFSVNTNQF